MLLPAPPVIPVIPIGPGERDRLRAGRVVDALVRCEADLSTVILLLDGVTEADLRPLIRPGHLLILYMTNPRRGRGSGIYDGLACGLTLAYGHIARQFPGHHAWKIDTDALVLRPTAGQIAAYFAAHPGVGIVGTYAHNPGGASRQRDIDPGIDVAKKFLRPVWYFKTSGYLSSPYWGRNRLFARWFRQAHAKGLPWGWHVQGGSYAIGAAMLAKWLGDGRLDDPELWLGCPMSEDVGFTHWAIIDGFAPADFNAPGEAFGVSAIGLPMPVEELIAADYGVVHSVKGGDWEAELARVDALVRGTAAAQDRSSIDRKIRS